MVEPGPNFSVADVCRGWVDGLRNAGQEVAVFNLADRLAYYPSSSCEDLPQWRIRLDEAMASLTSINR